MPCVPSCDSRAAPRGSVPSCRRRPAAVMTPLPRRTAKARETRYHPPVMSNKGAQRRTDSQEPLDGGAPLGGRQDVTYEFWMTAGEIPIGFSSSEETLFAVLVRDEQPIDSHNLGDVFLDLDGSLASLFADVRGGTTLADGLSHDWSRIRNGYLPAGEYWQLLGTIPETEFLVRGGVDSAAAALGQFESGKIDRTFDLEAHRVRDEGRPRLSDWGQKLLNAALVTLPVGLLLVVPTEEPVPLSSMTRTGAAFAGACVILASCHFEPDGVRRAGHGGSESLPSRLSATISGRIANATRTTRVGLVPSGVPTSKSQSRSSATASRCAGSIVSLLRFRWQV
jgi:hypothetical protein